MYNHVNIVDIWTMTSWSFKHAQVEGHPNDQKCRLPAFVGNHDVLHEHNLGRSFQIVFHGLSHHIHMLHVWYIYQLFIYIWMVTKQFSFQTHTIYHSWIYNCGACRAPYPHLENLGHQHVRVGSCLKCWSHYGFQY